MKIQAQVREDLAKATKGGDRVTTGAARLLLAALEYKRMQNPQAASMEGISDDEEISVVKTEVKKRQEAMEIYHKAGDKAREEQEQVEMDYMMKFMPAQMGEEEVRAVAAKVKSQLGGGVSTGILIGKVIAAIGKDKVDGSVVARVVNKSLLSS